MERDPNLARAAKLALSKYTINQNPLLKIILEAAARLVKNGAKRLSFDYDNDGDLASLLFSMEVGGQAVHFSITPNFSGVLAVLEKDRAVPRKTTGDLRTRFFEEIVPACPNLLFLLLTKRPSNINKMIPEFWKENPPPNVMFGTSPVDPPTFRTLVGQLRQVNGRRFLSVEPQLAKISPTSVQLAGIHWIIQGGESGPNRRPFNTDWARELRDVSAVHGIPYFFKQIDKVLPIPADLLIREFPEPW